MQNDFLSGVAHGVGNTVALALLISAKVHVVLKITRL